MAAIRSFLEERRGGYEEYEAEPEQMTDLGNGVVFAVSRETVRLAGGALDAKLREVWAYAFVCVGGMVARVTASSDIDEARAAAERLVESKGVGDVEPFGYGDGLSGDPTGA
ncbi:MAG: hypothetical protein ACHQAV_07225 [Solirubrobacterales bacterium]